MESYLDVYRPNAVVAMMGINDWRVKYFQDIPEARAWIFQNCRVYRLGRILWVYFLKKLRAEGVYSFVRASADPVRDVSRVDPSSRSSLFEVSRATTENDMDVFANPIQIAPQDSGAYVELGISSRDNGDFQKAINCFQKAIAINPRNSSAYSHLGELRRRQGSIVEARRLLEKAIELNPKDDNLYVALAGFQKRKKDFVIIEALLRKAMALNPRNDRAYVELGNLYLFVRNDFPRAERLFIEAMKAAPKTAYIPIVLGGHYRLRGDFTRAEALFKRAIEIDPQNERALEAITSLYEMIGKPELASEYARKIHASSLDYGAPVTIYNYRRLKTILDRRGVKLVCAQYPMRSLEAFKKIFEKDKGVIFVDNDNVFRKAVERDGYAAYFRDMFAGDFGHCTAKGNELLARNIADVILKEVFNK
ncbi:MAG: tetratricopeptide repeat protein [Candidatus Omnitrophota bacterium]